MLHTTFLNVILELLAIVSMPIANGPALHSTAHAHIKLVPHFCTLTCTFAWLQDSDNRGYIQIIEIGLYHHHGHIASHLL